MFHSSHVQLTGLSFQRYTWETVCLQMNWAVLSETHLGCIFLMTSFSFFFYSVPPKIINLSRDIVVNEGSNVTLMCQASGKPEPFISWKFVSSSGNDLLWSHLLSIILSMQCLFLTYWAGTPFPPYFDFTWNPVVSPQLYPKCNLHKNEHAPFKLFYLIMLVGSMCLFWRRFEWHEYYRED